MSAVRPAAVPLLQGSYLGRNTHFLRFLVVELAILVLLRSMQVDTALKDLDNFLQDFFLERKMAENYEKDVNQLSCYKYFPQASSITVLYN
jgi:hypothetical protein